MIHNAAFLDDADYFYPSIPQLKKYRRLKLRLCYGIFFQRDLNTIKELMQQTDICKLSMV